MKKNFQILKSLVKGDIFSIEYQNQYTNNYIENNTRSLHFNSQLIDSEEDYFGIFYNNVCIFFITKENFEKLTILKEDENNITIKYLEMEIFLTIK